MSTPSALGRRSRLALVLLGALVLQAVVLADLRVFGVAPDALLLVAVAAGVAGGPERGAVVGFAAGLTFDLLLTTPFGLSALAYGIAGYLTGVVHATVVRSALWIPVAAVAAGSAAGVLSFSLTAHVLGLPQPATARLVVIVVLVALLNAVLALPAVRVLQWSEVRAGPVIGGIRL